MSKEKISKEPMLTLPDFSKLSWMDCDANMTTNSPMLRHEGKLNFFQSKANEV